MLEARLNSHELVGVQLWRSALAALNVDSSPFVEATTVVIKAVHHRHNSSTYSSPEYHNNPRVQFARHRKSSDKEA